MAHEGESKQKKARAYIRYGASDFLLYLFSISLATLIVVPAIPGTLFKWIVLGVFAYLVCAFVLKHGAKLDFPSLKVLVQGTVSYPLYLLHGYRSVVTRFTQATLLFGAALWVEHLLKPHLDGTFWLRPFPWVYVVWGFFLAITFLRVIILIAHLRKADHVRRVLESSPVRKSLGGLSIKNHIVHAFVTGLVAHLCAVAPLVLLLSIMNLTFLREALLFGGYLILWIGAELIRHLYPSGSFFKSGLPHIRRDYVQLFNDNHKMDHSSRFCFTVLHGHHHDCLPSSLIGAAGGVGLLESSHRVIVWVDFLDSAIVSQMNWLFSIVIDMLSHQYIPGVFPYSQFVAKYGTHHVTHHFGSLLPLGFFIEDDVPAGYKPRNRCTQWFVGAIDQYEELSPDTRERFLTLGEETLGEEPLSEEPLSEETVHE